MVKRAILVCVCMLLAYGGQVALGAPAPAEREPVKLTLINYWTGARVPLMEAQLQKFQEQYPWITVENAVGGSIGAQMDKYIVSIVAGNPPDVWMVDRVRIAEFVEKGLLQPLDSFMRQDNFNPNIFYKSELQACQYQGKTYTLPMPTASLSLLYYNRALLAESGYDPDGAPRTWNEYLQMASRIQRTSADGRVEVGGGDIGYFPRHRMAQLAAVNGGQVFSGPYDVNYLSDRVLESADWAQEFVSRVPTGGDFTAGTRAMTTHGEWYYFETKAANPSIDIGIALLPHGPNGETVNLVAAAWSYGIPIGVKHPYESWLLIKFLTASEEGAKVFAFEQGRPSPVVRFNQDRRYFEINPYWGVIGETLNRSVVAPPSPLAQKFIDADIKYYGQLLARKESALNILTKLQDEINVLIADYKAGAQK